MPQVPSEASCIFSFQHGGAEHVLSSNDTIWDLFAHQMPRLYCVHNSFPVGKVCREIDCSLVRDSTGPSTRIDRVESELADHNITSPCTRAPLSSTSPFIGYNFWYYSVRALFLTVVVSFTSQLNVHPPLGCLWAVFHSS